MLSHVISIPFIGLHSAHTALQLKPHQIIYLNAILRLINNKLLLLLLNHPSSRCSRAAEIFHFRLIRIHSNAENSIFPLHYAVQHEQKNHQLYVGCFGRAPHKDKTIRYTTTQKKKYRAFLNPEKKRNFIKSQRFRDRQDVKTCCPSEPSLQVRYFSICHASEKLYH